MLPDAGGTFLTKHCEAMAWFPHDPIDAFTCCILCSRVNKLGNTGHQGPSHRRKAQQTISLIHANKWELHSKKRKITQLESPAAGKPVAEIINLFVDFFGTGGKEMEQRVRSRL